MVYFWTELLVYFSVEISSKTKEAKNINDTLENIRVSIIRHYREIEWQDVQVTAEKIRNAFLGITVKAQMLLVVFKNHNDDISKRIGKVDKF